MQNQLLWLKPRVGYTEANQPLLSPMRNIRPYYGNSADQDKQIRQRQYAASGQSSGSADAPIYLYGSGTQARRVRSHDIVGIMRRDERIAGYANIQGVIDCHKKIIAIQIRNTDQSNQVHGGFIHVHSTKHSREYYLPNKVMNVHLSHLKFITRPEDESQSLYSAKFGSKTTTQSAPSIIPKTPPAKHRADLQRYIRHHLSSRESALDERSSTGILNYKRALDLPVPKYGITSPLVSRHDSNKNDPHFWWKRAGEIEQENKYKDAVLERKNNGWGAPIKCVCGKWEHDCHNANCVYERAKIKGTNIIPKQKYEMPYDKARRNMGTTKRSRREIRTEEWQRKIFEKQQIVPETISSLDSDLLDRISRLALDAGSPKRTMPNVDKEAYRAEKRAFERLNLLDKEQADKVVDEFDWNCGVCQATNPGIIPTCTVCGRKKGRDLDTKNIQTKFMSRMLAGMKDGKSLAFDGREEKEASRKRRQGRIMERQTLVADKKVTEKKEVEQKEQKKMIESDSEDELDPEDDDKRGIAGVMQRQTRKAINLRTWNAIQQKTGLAKTMRFLAGTDFTDAVWNTDIADIKNGKRIQYSDDSLKKLYAKQMSSFGGEISNSDSDSGSSSSSDSDSSDDEEE